jgi:hypothetical protein
MLLAYLLWAYCEVERPWRQNSYNMFLSNNFRAHAYISKCFYSFLALEISAEENSLPASSPSHFCGARRKIFVFHEPQSVEKKIKCGLFVFNILDSRQVRSTRHCALLDAENSDGERQIGNGKIRLRVALFNETPQMTTSFVRVIFS